MNTYFDRFTISMTKEQARQCSHAGECIEDVKELARLPEIKKQFKAIDPGDIRAELKEYGTWDENELQDDTENWYRILWIAAGNITHPNG